MKLSKNQSGVAETIVVGVLLVAAVVVVGVLVVNKNKKSTSSSKSNSTVSATGLTPSGLKLNNSLVTLGIQHMRLTDQAVAATLDGSKDASALGAALYANGDTIGKAVGSVYGDDAMKTFDSVWKLHLDQFVAYAVASSKGDAAGKQAALDTIQTKYTVPLAQYLAKANPNLPENVLQTSLTDHVTMTAGVIDDHVAGDYTKEAADLDAADQHMTELFSTLSGAIVKQYPDKFAN